MDAPSASKPTTAAIPAPAWLGRRVGRFKLIAFLGKGAMGKVFRAEDVQLQRQVALKVLPLKIQTGGKQIGVEQFVREARSAAAIEHPGIVHVYEVNQTPEVFYIAMELIEGGSLRDLVKASGPMDMLRACQLGAEAAEALGQAHSLGIVHRDVKPSNLMLSRSGRCKVGDFGLCRIDDPSDSFSLATETVGTPLYIAPEILRGDPADARSDIYSLAATVFYLLCGRPPFTGKTAGEIFEKHLNEIPPSLLEFRPELPPNLDETIQRGLAKMPGDRFDSANRFASALRVHTIPIGSSGAISGSAVGSSGHLGANASGANGTLANASGAGLVGAASNGRNRYPVAIGAGVAAVIIAAGAAVYYFCAPAPKATPGFVDVSQFQVPHATPPANPVPSPDSASPLPVAALPAPTLPLSAADAKTIISVANDNANPLHNKLVTVVGTPNKVHVTSSGNVRLTFQDADADAGFQIFVPSELLDDMQKRFGGANGADILGKNVAVEGVISMYKSRPQIRISSVNQISLVK